MFLVTLADEDMSNVIEHYHIGKNDIPVLVSTETKVRQCQVRQKGCTMSRLS